MRIGIITFHNAINYGAVLQCYALKEFLQSRGHDVEVIDYRLPYLEDYKKFLPMSSLRENKGVTRKLRFIFRELLLHRKKQRKIRFFDEFVKMRLNRSRRCSSVHDIPTYYDCIFFGSDQIWSPQLSHGLNPVYWGQFPKGDSKFISYAVSLGELSNVSEDQWKTIGDYLQSFDYVSVRERSLQYAFNKRCHKEVDCCLDPVLIAPFEVLDNLASNPSTDNYVFLYNVSYDKHAVDFACRVASAMNCQVVMVGSKPSVTIKPQKNCILVEDVSPEQFLGYIKHARCVIGNSFHVIALSLIFNKEFISLDSPRPDRVINLLEPLNLRNRIVKSTDKVPVLVPINYKEVNKKIVSLRKESLLFIEKTGC